MSQQIDEIDIEIMDCQDQFKRACSALYESLPDKDKGKLFLAAHRIIVSLREANPRLTITTFELIDAILSAQYYARFGESPVETALKARHSK
mgnify:CR=1 FL=1